ncbi:methyl-accepting chemotaxis protein [Brevibacillus migulae]|uniref:methyl-accepting chemotaxis protein n=1 Tax=Brevibacillus migulae TaxID=1644114 RepID=UPI001F34DE38|nr:methyl-accepting chemotaxis protein [Brevibacillus migulae]
MRESLLRKLNRLSPRRPLSFSLSRKIIAAFIIVSLLVAVTSGLSFVFIKKIDSTYLSVLNENAVMLNQAADVQSYTQLQNSMLFSYLVDPAKEKEEQLLAANKQLAAILKELQGQNSGSEMESDINQMIESNETFARLVTKVTDYMNRNQPDLAKSEAMLWSVPATETLTKTSAKIQELQKKIMADKMADSQTLVLTILTTLIAVSLVALALAIGIGIVLSRMIVKPMRTMVQAAGRIADCDLTFADVHVANRDELRDLATAFNRMKANLHQMISEVGAHSDQVAASAVQLSASSGQVSESLEQVTAIIQDISIGTQEQVRSVHQGVSIIEEMSSAVGEIATVTQSADMKSVHALEAAAAGNEAIRVAVGQMNSIQKKMSELSESVQRLGSSSDQIVKTVDVITNIAKQTNLLALNASIEAARAGESGKGFAVVADEVRKLSQLTSEAADEVGRLISGIRAETADVVISTEDGKKEVSTGISVVGQAGEAFQRIQSAVNEVADQIRKVSAQSKEIASESKTAVAAIRSIDTVALEMASSTQHVSRNVETQNASMEEIVASSAVLSTMAEELQGLIGRFKV